MRLLPESPRNQRFLAVVLLLIAVLLIYLLFVHFWFVAPHLAISDRRNDLLEQQHHFAELIQRKPAIEKRLQEVAEYERGNQAFLAESDVSSAFSDLSERLKQAVDKSMDPQSRCQVVGVSPTVYRDQEVYQRVSASVVMNCESEVLTKVLYALETSNPYLFVDRFVLYRQQPMFQPGAKGAAPASLLGAQFTLSGYLRQPGKGRSAP